MAGERGAELTVPGHIPQPHRLVATAAGQGFPVGSLSDGFREASGRIGYSRVIDVQYLHILKLMDGRGRLSLPDADRVPRRPME
jgi:hypothetical protein